VEETVEIGKSRFFHRRSELFDRRFPQSAVLPQTLSRLVAAGHFRTFRRLYYGYGYAIFSLLAT
jgi:hypothetical protein